MGTSIVTNTLVPSSKYIVSYTSTGVQNDIGRGLCTTWSSREFLQEQLMVAEQLIMATLAEVPPRFIKRFEGYPRHPSIQTVPTLVPKVCIHNTYFGLFGSLGVCWRTHVLWGPKVATQDLLWPIWSFRAPEVVQSPRMQCMSISALLVLWVHIYIYIHIYIYC